MKKLFLIPLLACFACVTVWAATVVTSVQDLQDKINAASASAVTELQLSSTGDFTFTSSNNPICIYDRKIVLDLNGKTIDAGSKIAFHVIRGSFEIKGEGSVTSSAASTIRLYGDRRYYANATDAQKKVTYFKLGENVTVVNTSKVGVDVYTYAKGGHAVASEAFATAGTEQNIAKNANRADNWSDFAGLTDELKTAAESTVTKHGDTSGSKADANWGYAFGLTADIYGTVTGHAYGIQVSGVINSGDGKLGKNSWSQPSRKATPNADGTYDYNDNHAYMNIYPSAHVGTDGIANAGTPESPKYPTGIYAAGFAHVNIKGEVSGANGIVAKAGMIVISGEAQVKSTGELIDATHANAGTKSSGAAISATNDNIYSGVISILIVGSPTLSSTQGYAFVEDNVSTNDHAVDNNNGMGITIAGGTFTGSPTMGYAPIVTTDGVKQQMVENGSITSGTFSGTYNQINEYLNQDDKIIDPVETSEGTVFIVGQLPENTSMQHEDLEDLSSHTSGNAYVTITNTDEDQELVIGENGPEHVVLGYLTLVDADNILQITIKGGSILEAGQIVMGENSQIIVEPGAKLILTGSNGIVSFFPENLIIQANASQSGVLVLSPAVTSNKTPFATVQYAAHCGRRASDNQVIWDIFTSPFSSISSIDSDPSYFRHNVGGYWVSTNRNAVIADTKAFEPIAISTNTAEDDYVYEMKGQLHGNMSGIFRLYPGFNYIGNGYMGMLNVQALLQALRASGSVRSGYYIYNPATDNYTPFTELDADGDNLPPMKMIVLYAEEGNDVDLNYGDLIWEINK